jgi:hypothetical protein
VTDQTSWDVDLCHLSIAGSVAEHVTAAAKLGAWLVVLEAAMAGGARRAVAARRSLVDIVAALAVAVIGDPVQAGELGARVAGPARWR